MGYCIELLDHDFKVKKENEENLLKALKEFVRNKKRIAWVTPSVILYADNIIEAFDELRYEMAIDENGDYILSDFYGEKLGDDYEIFESIAKYIEPDSFIEFLGEDGDRFKFVFDGTNCKEKSANFNYD